MIRKNYHITEGLLVQYLRDELSPEVKARVDLWLTESTENQQTLRRVKQFWDTSATLAPWLTTNAEAEWQIFQRNAGIQQSGGKIRYLTPLRIYALAAAVMALFVTLMVFPGLRGQQKYMSENQTRTINLQDGSQVVLNKYSTLTVDRRFGNNRREVQLRGEGFFEVAHDKQNPFYVKTPDATIRVVGTSFNVVTYRKSAITEVTVRTGLVEIKNKARTKTVMLKEGHKAVVNSKNDTIKASQADNFNEMAWNTRKLTFRNAPLERVCRQLSRTYGQAVFISSEPLNKCRISVTFENQSLESALRVIGETLMVKVEKRGNEFHLTGNGCQ